MTVLTVADIISPCWVHDSSTAFKEPEATGGVVAPTQRKLHKITQETTLRQFRGCRFCKCMYVCTYVCMYVCSAEKKNLRSSPNNMQQVAGVSQLVLTCFGLWGLGVKALKPFFSV